MRRVGMKLIADKKEALEHDLKTGSTSHGRDLLTLLIKSNMAYENESHRMSDDEVLGRKCKPAAAFLVGYLNRGDQKYQPSLLPATRLRVHQQPGPCMC
jgi:hypothetical protein